ncbi:unnamed protein product [Diabrotica balteata]|uniref:DUF4371 domain-containing protein n=1 Tax=Diabrotica balteata TaxID=107213 RepID=A0A9N9T1Z7_DIABA|nr:unnamed protein product [Diabrotica balteata]
MFKKYDLEFSNLLSGSKTFSGVSKTIQNELIESLSYILSNFIEFEIQETICFLLEVDETTDISCHSQLSIVVQYALCGNIYERFLGFTDVSKSHKAEYIFGVLKDRLKFLDIKNKLVGQTYDGAAVMSGELNGLQAKVKTITPQALFTHCHAHRMNLVLQDTYQTAAPTVNVKKKGKCSSSDSIFPPIVITVSPDNQAIVHNINVYNPDDIVG